ncbi:MAG: carboxypeptidase-like regulatory domain-containing protein [Acidobacteriota bacterium]|mgnify:CR=1 FL=1
MNSLSLPAMVVLAAAVSPLAAQQKPQPKPSATATGVFVGRSGKPMAKARVILGQVAGDQDTTQARIKLPASAPSATTDDQGRFEFKGFTPGEYTIVYTPSGATAIFPAEISVKAFQIVVKSIAPLLRGVELGKGLPFDEREWGRYFILLKGHTFWGQGPEMKIWNATARWGKNGPYMELRRGFLWLQKIDDKTAIKFDAWSY